MSAGQTSHSPGNAKVSLVSDYMRCKNDKIHVGKLPALAIAFLKRWRTDAGFLGRGEEVRRVACEPAGIGSGAGGVRVGWIYAFARIRREVDLVISG